MNIQKTAVIGAGLMGKNIAFVLSAVPGVQVTVYDIRETDLESGVRENTRQLVEKGVLSTEELEERLGRMRFTLDMADPGIAEADLIVEAVFEDMTLKRKTFAQLEAVCTPECLFCTNSSVMSPTEISAEMQYKARFVGTHFWNPAHLIPLVEVVKSDYSADETALAVLDFLRRAGKQAVLCKKDVPGFIANRMQHALWREAISIVERGIADAKTVDDAVKYSFGLRLPQLPPLENADMVGTDLTLQIHDYILRDLEDSHAPSPLLRQLNEQGDLGFKSGKGFMSWTDEEIQASREGLNEYLIKMIYDK